MELLNFTSNGCRFIYYGKISEFNVFDNEKQVVESKTALIISTIIKYEVRKTIDNDTIKSVDAIDLNQFYEDKLLRFDYDSLYSTIMKTLKVDAIYSNILSHNVNQLLNKEYFIEKTKPKGGFVILVKTEDNENYIGLYEDNAIKLSGNAKNPIEFAKNILKRDDIAKVECTKVDNIYSVLKDIERYHDYRFIYYKYLTISVNSFISYTTLDDMVFDITSFDNHLAVTVKDEEPIKWYTGNEFPELKDNDSIHILIEFKNISDVMAKNVIGDFYYPERLEGPFACLKCDDKVVNFENKKDFASRVKRWRYMG